MGSRGFLGFIIILIFAVLWSIFFGQPKINKMEQAVQANLDSNGYSSFAKATLDGNVVTLTGEAPSQRLADDAVNVAQNTKCPTCKKDKNWHSVENKFDIAKDTIPTQSPFTFNGEKSDDGSVTLTGFVGSKAAKDNVIAKAQSIFGSKLASANVTIAKGAPNDVWSQVVQMDMEQLSQLNTGRFEMEDRRNFITGQAASDSVKASVDAAGASMPGGFDFSANISVDNVGEVKSEALCQQLINGLKDGKNINFETSRADIKGAASFDLLNELASVANRCSAFVISIEGHTDSQGGDAANLNLSERRANAVLAYLKENNVDAARLRARGFGETQPIATNDTREGRAKNRRIEFTVTESQ